MILININNKKLHYIIKKHELSPSLAPPKVALRDRRSWRCFLWPTGPCPAPDGIQLALLNHVETNNISQTNEYYIIITIIIIYYYYIYIIMDSYIIMDNYSKKYHGILYYHCYHYWLVVEPYPSEKYEFVSWSYY